MATLSEIISQLLLRTVRVDDPWRRFRANVPLARFGIGAKKEFSWYLEGESRVTVSSLDDVMAWLRQCKYARDPDLFRAEDFWQHPLTFEQIRMGDCEDFALWAWRKLIRLGYNVEFVAGRIVASDAPPAGHAWVHLRLPDGVFLIESVLPGSKMLLPIEDVRDHYIPEVSVDGKLRRYAYGGYYILRRGSSGDKNR